MPGTDGNLNEHPSLRRRDAIPPPANERDTIPALDIPRRRAVPVAEGTVVVTVGGERFELFAKKPLSWRAELFALRHSLIITTLIGMVVGAILARVIP